MSRRPNILFVFTDQQTRNAMSAVGNPWVHTPHMDSLARNGTLFTNAYCVSPVCTPSRAGMVTGRMPHETGIEWNNLPIPSNFPTLGEIFREANYETAWAGAWHLPESFPEGAYDIRGFRNMGVPPSPLRRLGARVDEAIADRAIEFVRQEHQQPFLLGVSLINPHDICYWIMENESELLNQFQPGGELPPLPPNFDPDRHGPEFIQICRQRDHYGNEQQWTRSWDESRWRTYLGAYYRMVEHADANLGRILTALCQSGLEDDTLIVFTSDHGEGMAAHRWIVKLMLWEEVAGVPFIVSWKGKTPAGRVDREHLVGGLDIMPTLCDYAGISPPKGLHGRSLRPIVEGGSSWNRKFIVTELLPDLKRVELKGRMVRTRRYKYVVFSHGNSPEMFFDLERDPDETDNLAARSAHQDELRRHRELLRGWMAKTKDAFQFPIPA